MQEQEKFGTCQYCSPTGNYCKEIDMGNGFCFWHDPAFDKNGMELTDKLERYANQGGITQGLQLKHANLEGINLVRKGSHLGYDFSGSDFYRANLKGAHLFNLRLDGGSLMKADLTDANLHCAKLHKTNLLGVKFLNTKIDNIQLGKYLLQEEKAKQAEKNKDRPTSIDNYEQAEEIYRDVRKAAENQGLFELAGYCIHRELTMRRMQMVKFSKMRITSKIIDLFCGYGERPANVVIFSLCLILSCAVGYYLLGVQFGTELIQINFDASLSDNIFNFFSALYYSVVTFTTLGYGDITPIGAARVIAACEAFAGSFTMALFVVVFVKKMTR